MTSRSAGFVLGLGYLVFGVGCVSIGTPRLLSPEEGAVLTFLSHVVDFQWTPVPGAARYRIEFDGYYCGDAADRWCSEVNGRAAMAHEISLPKYTSNNELLGNQPWRWRVSPIDKQGRPGTPTGWRQVVFSQPQPPSGAASSFRDPTSGETISGAGIAGPRPIYSPRAQYPQAGLKERISGQVIMEVVVDAEGRVQSVRVSQSLRSYFDDSAVAAVRTWRFEPARRDGKAVPAAVTISMSFSAR